MLQCAESEEVLCIKLFRWNTQHLSHARGGHVRHLSWSRAPFIHCDFHSNLYQMWLSSQIHAISNYILL